VSEDLIEELINFVRLQLDKDERVATDGQRAGLDDGWPFWIDTDDISDYEAANAYRDHFNPARVLREVESFRKIIDYCAAAIEVGRIPEGATWSDDAAGAEVGEVVLRHLAAIFSDRPGYRGEWRPQ
jgi:hypothetical protein